MSNTKPLKGRNVVPRKLQPELVKVRDRHAAKQKKKGKKPKE